MTNWIDEKINDTVVKAVAEAQQDLDILLHSAMYEDKLDTAKTEEIIYKVQSVIQYLVKQVREKYEHDSCRPF